MLSGWMLRLRALFKRTVVEQEIDDELRFHVDRQVASHVARGSSHAEAIRRARLEFGGVDQIKEEYRDALGTRLVGSALRDLRMAVRTLRATPVVTTVATLSLALGIGANTAIFSLINSLLLRALPVAEAQRLTVISSGTGGPGADQWTSATWEQIAERAGNFDGAFAWSGARLDLTIDGDTQPVSGLYASGHFFAVLGVPAFAGRTLTAADDVTGGGADGPVAVISYGLWQRLFGGAPTAIGRQVVIKQVPFRIVGVTPQEFFGVEVGRTFDVILPLGIEPMLRDKGTAVDAPSTRWLRIMLRLKPQQSIDAASATLRALQPQIREGAMPSDFPQLQKEFLKQPFALVPAVNGISSLRQRYQRPLLAVLILVGLVLLIACANIANLLLARATARRHELRVRQALGAARWQLVGQLLTESLVLSVTGAAMGLLFAAWTSRLLVAQLAPGRGTPVFLDLPFDSRVMIFTVIVTIGTALLFGTIPALRATRALPVDALNERNRNSPRGRGGMSLSTGLVIAQVALSLLLVVAAGLFVTTFRKLAGTPLGFDVDRVLLIDVRAPGHIAPAERADFYHRLAAAAAAVPGVAHAAGSMMPPLSGSFAMFVDSIGGIAAGLTDDKRVALVNFVTPGWFPTYGTPLHAGRDIAESDAKIAEPIALVNEAFVQRFLSNRHPIGATITVGLGPQGQTRIGAKSVVGVVGNAAYRSVREEVQPTMYLPLAQWPDVGIPLSPTVYLAVRPTTGSPAALAPSVAAMLRGIDRDVTLTFHPLADQVEASMAQERLVAMLSGFFGLLALLLAGLGLYGVTAYTVTRRRMEIGIRMALGASPGGIARLVLTRVAIQVGIGIVIGAIASLWAAKFVASLLFGLEPRDPLTFIGGTITLGAIAAVAAWLPTWRASHIDPAAVLRES